MKRLVGFLFPVLLCIGLNAQVLGSSTVVKNEEQTKITVLVVYYSVTGNTEKMAQAVATGARKNFISDDNCQDT